MEKLEIEDKMGDYALIPVPQKERRTLLNQLLVNMGYVICLAGLFAGGTLGMGIDFKSALIATIIGSSILATYAGLQAKTAARWGVSTPVLARYPFGRFGAAAVAILIFILNGIGWFAYETALFGITVHEMFPDAIWADPTIAIIWGGILMTITAIYGYRAIGFLSFLAVPLILVLATGGLFAAMQSLGSFQALLAARPPGEPLTISAGITITVGYFAIGAACQPDVARYAKSERVATIAAVIAFLIGNVWILIAGVAMILATSVAGIGTTPNLPASMVALGLGAGALAVSALGQWTTNDNNLYTGSLALINIIPIPKKILAVVVGVGGTIIAAIGIYEYWIPWLVILGTFVPPVAGIMIADHFVLGSYLKKKQYKFGPKTVYSKVNLSGVISLVLSGFLVWKIIVIPFIPAAVIGLLLAFFTHIILSLIFEKLKILEFGKTIESEIGF
ncbi:MAG TPA: cytosine permease [Thermoplasmata archaeon]|nr:cytosine permease [Thermoplasmata archaeon]